MPWLKIDDKWLMHAKTRAMGRDARDLWIGACAWSADQMTDGYVPLHMLPVIAVLMDVPPECVAAGVARLVQLGSWHEVGDLDCACCQRDGLPSEPGWVVHDWLEYQPERDDVLHERAKAQRKRELRSREFTPLRQAVRARDGDECRYCGNAVVWQGPGKASTFGATFDHVDPALGNTLDNVVVACRSCNSAKKDRTPEQAGMRLRAHAGQVAEHLARVTTPPKGEPTPPRPTPARRPRQPATTPDPDPLAAAREPARAANRVAAQRRATKLASSTPAPPRKATPRKAKGPPAGA